MCQLSNLLGFKMKVIFSLYIQIPELVYENK